MIFTLYEIINANNSISNIINLYHSVLYDIHMRNIKKSHG